MLAPVTVAAVHHSFAQQGAMATLGATITALDDGYCELRAPFSPAAAQQHGYFHCGVIGALADTAGGYAANSKLMPQRECLTAEYKINMLAPGEGDTLIARGKVVRAGRSLVVVSVDVAVLRDGVEHPCALAQMTMFVIEARL